MRQTSREAASPQVQTLAPRGSQRVQEPFLPLFNEEYGDHHD